MMRIGMVGTRFAGLDGVTLEARKIADLLQRNGHSVAWFAGVRDPGFAPGVTVPSAHFEDAAELARQREYFGASTRRIGLADEVRDAAAELAGALRDFVRAHRVDVLMAQNALAIPMQLPLALAIAEVVAEGLPAIGHHHDFAWERGRFSVTSIQDFLDAAFPPRLPGLQHWTISSIASSELGRRTGLRGDVVPNVMDFAAGPPTTGDATAFRAAAGLDLETPLLLQPTRVIPRKSIETSLEVATEVPGSAVVVTHAEGDEGWAYGAYLGGMARKLGVDLRFVPLDGGDVGLADAYAAADLVVYPSRIEGFGNALVEAFYYRRPVVVRRYPVYVADIAPAGVRCIEIDDHPTADAIGRARRWIEDPSEWADVVEHNYAAGLRSFSYEVAEAILQRTLEATRP